MTGSLELGSYGGYVVQGFDAGYVASNDGTVWFAPDGSSWEPQMISERVSGCAGFLDPTPPVELALSAASNGSTVVLGGLAYEPGQCFDYEAPPDHKAFVWVSNNGRDWQRSEVFGSTDVASVSAVWPIDGGWEAIVVEGQWWFDQADQHVALWRSSDGLAWSEVGIIRQGQADNVIAAVADDGMRVVSLDGVRIAMSTDGASWSDVSPPFPRGSELGQIVAPIDGAPWLFVAHIRDPRGELSQVSIAWHTFDLSEWGATPFPRRAGTVGAVEPIPGGYFAEGTACIDQFDYCEPEPPRHYLSADGVAWQRFEPALSSQARYTLGPAGLLALILEDGTTWLLEH